MTSRRLRERRSRARKLARDVASLYGRALFGERPDRDGLSHALGLTEQEARAAWDCIIAAEKAPNEIHLSEESGSSLVVTLSEEILFESLLRASSSA